MKKLLIIFTFCFYILFSINEVNSANINFLRPLFKEIILMRAINVITVYDNKGNRGISYNLERIKIFEYIGRDPSTNESFESSYLEWSFLQTPY